VSGALNFTPEALSGIFLGRISKWNDPAIAGANKGVNLPGNDIVVIHRSDGSGTTYIWTDYLSKVNSDWKDKVGKGASVNWPVGLGGKGNEGVTGLIKQTPNAIGYVELIYAAQNKVPYGVVKNASGSFVKADLASVTEAAAGAVKSMPEDFPRFDYQCSRQNGLSDCELYMAADSGKIQGHRQARRNKGLREMGDYGRPRWRRRSFLCQAPQGSRGKRTEGN